VVFDGYVGALLKNMLRKINECIYERYLPSTHTLFFLMTSNNEPHRINYQAFLKPNIKRYLKKKLEIIRFFVRIFIWKFDIVMMPQIV